MYDDEQSVQADILPARSTEIVPFKRFNGQPNDDRQKRNDEFKSIGIIVKETEFVRPVIPVKRVKKKDGTVNNLVNWLHSSHTATPTEKNEDESCSFKKKEDPYCSSREKRTRYHSR